MLNSDLKNIRQVELEDLTNYMQEHSLPAFHAKQVREWLWKKGATSFDEMSNLPKTLRESLNEDFEINAITEDIEQKSEDGTIKVRFKLFDGPLIEGVLIPTKKRVTACVSSQSGCSLSCAFCATGFLGLKRHLQAGEIYDQVRLLNEKALAAYERPLTNIVFMGMGEPLLNFKNVVKSIKLIGQEGLGISTKRITISTAGIAKMIKELGDANTGVNLALSLHAANDKKRNEIMAINQSNRLSLLVGALHHFHRNTKNKISFEYILFDGFNDSLDDAKELAELCRKSPVAMVNLIEYNSVDQVPFQKSNVINREAFISYLEKEGITVKVRRSRGQDIDAACGQLANKA